MKGAVCKLIYDEVIAENKKLKEELKFSHDCRCSARDAYESVIKKVGDENKELKEEMDSLQKSNKQKTKIIHRFRKNMEELMPPELTYKETKGDPEPKYEKNTVYYDFNEGMDEYYGDKKPVSIYWDSKDERVNEYMDEHYNYRSGGADWRFLKPIKDKFWKKGERLCFRTKTNAEGYFNIWLSDDYEGSSFYRFINEDGFLYSSVMDYQSDIPCKFNNVE